MRHSQVCTYVTERENLQYLDCSYHFLFEDFVSAQVTIMSIMGLGMSTNLSLVLLLLLAGLLCSKILLSIHEKRSREKTGK